MTLYLILREIWQLFVNCFRQILARLVRGSPPKNDDLVSELVISLGLTEFHVLQMYRTFHRLKQTEVAEVVTSAHSIQGGTLEKLLVERRKWCAPLLRALLQLAYSEEGQVSWDEYLFILLRFCSLNQVELAQALFLCIHVHLQSIKPTYLTRDQLQSFYAFYAKRSCPRAFNTSFIDFDRLHLSRYYVTDFVELVQRFGQLLNPMRTLQRAMQARLPTSDFWDNYDFYGSFSRKITEEFFALGCARVHLYGDPIYVETCDMMLPDALGFDAINQDQWALRTNKKFQVSTWGYQLPPELADHLPADYIESTMHSHLNGDDAAGAQVGAARHQQAHGLGGFVSDEPRPASWPRAGPAPSPGHGFRPASGPGPRPPVSSLRGAARAEPLPSPQQRAERAGTADLDPSHLSMLAAVTDELDDPPIELLPPSWMRVATCAPAPRRRGRHGRVHPGPEPDGPEPDGPEPGGPEPGDPEPDAPAPAVEAWSEPPEEAAGLQADGLSRTNVKGFRVTFHHEPLA